jgi:hypothetical protein
MIPSSSVSGPTATFTADASSAQISGTAGSAYDGTLAVFMPDATTHHYDFGLSRETSIGENISWMRNLDSNGHSVRFSGLDDEIDTEHIQDSQLRGTTGFTVEFRMYGRSFPDPAKRVGPADAHLFHLWESHNSDVEWSIYYNTGFAPVPIFHAGSHALHDANAWSTYMTPNAWHQIKITVSQSGGNATTTLYIDGQLVTSPGNPNPYTAAQNYTGGDWALSFGDFVGDIDEVRISNIMR